MTRLDALISVIALALALLAGCAHVRSSARQVSVDVGVQYTDAAYPFAGATAPVGPINVSAGVWTGIDGSVGPYASVGWSWQPFVKGE